MPDYGCFIGGPPLLLVEEAPADLSPEGRAAQSFSVTTRTLSRLGMAGIGLLIALAFVGYSLRRWRSHRRSMQ